MKRREWGRDHVVISLSGEFWPSMGTMLGVPLANEETLKSLPISSLLFYVSCSVPAISWYLSDNIDPKFLFFHSGSAGNLTNFQLSNWIRARKEYLKSPKAKVTTFLNHSRFGCQGCCSCCTRFRPLLSLPVQRKTLIAILVALGHWN